MERERKSEKERQCHKQEAFHLSINSSCSHCKAHVLTNIMHIWCPVYAEACFHCIANAISSFVRFITKTCISMHDMLRKWNWKKNSSVCLNRCQHCAQFVSFRFPRIFNFLPCKSFYFYQSLYWIACSRPMIVVKPIYIQIVFILMIGYESVQFLFNNRRDHIIYRNRTISFIHWFEYAYYVMCVCRSWLSVPSQFHSTMA